MKKSLVIAVVFNFLTVCSFAQDTSRTLTSLLKEQYFPSYANINLMQSLDSHDLYLGERSDWRVALAERKPENKFFVFEKDASGSNGKSLAQFDLNSDGTMRDMITFFSAEKEKESSLRFTAFNAALRVSSTTICWNLKSCLTLDHNYCAKMLKAQKSNDLLGFLKKEPSKNLIDQQALNQFTIMNSTAIKRINAGHWDGLAPGNSIPRIIVADIRQPEVKESLKICGDMMASIKVQVPVDDGVKPIRKRPIHTSG